jgi:hypothetical protein
MKRIFQIESFIAFSVVLFVMADRFLWATISQWREDQATNIWLGYTQNLFDIPVGLISSQDIPNPNGMVILAFFLSRLPGLLVISWVLGIIQAILLAWLSWSFFGKSPLFYLTAIILLASAVLRAISIEFWNQWIMVYPNALFFIWIASFYKKPNLMKIPFVIFLIIFTPSLYLGGIVNSLSFSLIASLIIFKKIKCLNYKQAVITLVISFILIGLLLILTWIPYIQRGHLVSILSYSKNSNFTFQLLLGIISFLSFQILSSTVWLSQVIPFAIFFDKNILPSLAQKVIGIHNFILLFQSILFYLSIGLALHSSYFKKRNFDLVFRPEYKNQGLFLILIFVFLLSCFTISPLLKGPFWIIGERVDQTLQFFPFFLILWFATPFVLNLPDKYRNYVLRFSRILAVAFLLINVYLGIESVRSVYLSGGNGQSIIDVPLIQKLKVTKYIAAEWKAHSSQSSISIFYELNDGTWDWMYDFGPKLNPWYSSPYTIGRAYDFELLRTYNLHNEQEGIDSKNRSDSQAKYIVSYSFLNYQPPKKQNEKLDFGLLSVFIAPE